jgi:hypothetical protein
MIMGDDRAVQATYVAGKLLYEKTGRNAEADAAPRN